ncbi:MAG: hypothetical protein Q8O37_11110 [Sulfuricellaceae bacterium]|nr:hypothetical protein [Sulfuricellaceae bacterium]
MNITYDGLLAGVRFLNVHCPAFDYGTGDDFRTPFIHDLLTEIFRASGISVETLCEPLCTQEMTAQEDHQDTTGLLVFLVGPDGERLVSTIDLP